MRLLRPMVVVSAARPDHSRLLVPLRRRAEARFCARRPPVADRSQAVRQRAGAAPLVAQIWPLRTRWAQLAPATEQGLAPAVTQQLIQR